MVGSGFWASARRDQQHEQRGRDAHQPWLAGAELS
jgi:hypothetical protein